MKRIIPIVVVIIILVAIVLGVLFLLTQHSPTGSANNSTGSTNQFPISGNSSQNSNSNTTASSSNSGLYSVENTMGGTLITKDFIHNGTTVEDQNNKDDYYLAGAPEYCSGGVCPSGTPTPDYYIVYRQSAKSFIIGLDTEPLSQTRQTAEQFLMSSLGLSQTQMCDLNYYVLTTSDVSPIYAGENLGFSFCPGAVPLPQ